MALRLTTASKRGDGLPLAIIRGGARDKQLLVHDEEPLEGSAQLITLEPDERFQIIPETRPGMRSVFHIVGPSGAGKSTLAGEFARAFKEIWPTSRVIIVSTVDAEDPAFSDLDHTRVEIDEGLNDIGMPELAASAKGAPVLLVFDDVEGLPKAKKLALESFQQRALETGRKLKIHTLSLFHRAAAGNSTKTLLSEANGLAFFPRTSTGNLGYALEKHFSIPPAIRTMLKDGWGRWVLLRTDGSPSYILGERRASIYDAEELQTLLRRQEKRERAQDSALARAQAKALLSSAAHPMD